MIDILVVDDHALIRKGLIMLLEENPEFHIKGEAETGMQGRRVRCLRDRASSAGRRDG
jgi:DNA-binding NarL/FixJ family response regulator